MTSQAGLSCVKGEGGVQAALKSPPLMREGGGGRGISLDKQVTAATLPSAFSSPSISLSLTSGWL
jgi:hypothetical protein